VVLNWRLAAREVAYILDDGLRPHLVSASGSWMTGHWSHAWSTKAFAWTPPCCTWDGLSPKTQFSGTRG
jgi:hypothetical protein